MVTLLRKIIGDPGEKAIDKIAQTVVPEINDLEPEMQARSDEQLGELTQQFRDRLARGETLDDILPEAFAAVREVARRNLGQRHYDVQLIGGIVLHRGQIAEMKTGEGKTLVATLPVYLNALTGKGVHVVTVNDYLARRDPVWMGPIYRSLGLTVGCLQHDSAFMYDPSVERGPNGIRFLRPVSRQEAYQADVLYGTNSEFGFDYLRTNMARESDQRVQGSLNYAIVDEVDNILIDEARTPLIISGPAPRQDEDYRKFARLINRLNEQDYIIDERTQAISLSQEGIEKMEQWVQVDNLYDPGNFHLVHYVENALTARVQKQRDKDYVVQEGEVIIVDEFTGRLQYGRRWSDGLHQAVEAKEGAKIQEETLTYATITLQNYFRMYEKLAGMTGTASTESDEFYKIYGLDVAIIPTNLPMVRDDKPDLVFQSVDGKRRAVVEEVVRIHQTGQPLLIGTASVEGSNELSGHLKRRGVKHEVLNATNHAREADIVAQAGRLGAVTVSTNMAGRGTDIVLGGANTDDPDWLDEHNKVIELGGLYVLGTEHHDARRIDNQLRGRSGRQGDPGTSQFYVALEDELMQRFGGDRIKSVMGWTGMDDETPIENKLISKSITGAQEKVEGYHFDIRKHLLNFDDVLNTQREVIYARREQVLNNSNLRDIVIEMLRQVFSGLMRRYLPDRHSDNWDVTGFVSELALAVPLPPALADEDLVLHLEWQQVAQILEDYAEELYVQREKELGESDLGDLQRMLLLSAVDHHWRNHLTEMENLRTGVGLHAYGQRDPLVVYRTQGYREFEELLNTINTNPLVELGEGITAPFFRVLLSVSLARPAPRRPSSTLRQNGSSEAAPRQPGAGNGRQASPTGSKIGRNARCPCGSGKKYKRCCGASV